MRTLLATVLMLFSATVTPGQQFTQWFDALHFGAPCTTKIDRIELPTCQLDVKRKPNWK